MIPPVHTDAFDVVFDLFESANLEPVDGFSVRVDDTKIEVGTTIATIPALERVFASDLQMAGTFAPTIVFGDYCYNPVTEVIEVLVTTVIRVLRQFQQLT